MSIGRYLAHSMGMYGYGWLFEIVILMIFFALVYWIVKSSQKESALDILNRRYANNEISRKEYLGLKKEILSV
ncbi:MAG: SHOCT domain-containing protein [Candidatus Nanoarchaeia archaeon]